MNNLSTTLITENNFQGKNDSQTFNIASAQGTADAANQYAHELRAEFNQLLYAAIARTDKKVAGRFSTLIHELCAMTSYTLENIKKESRQ